MSELIAPAVNLLILVGVLAYYLRAPIRQFVSGRHAGLRDELLRVRGLLEKAKNQFDEFSAKLGALDAESASIRSQATQDAQAAKQRILAEAQKLSTNISADARRSADALYADLRETLYQELGSSVLERAETVLRERLTGDDRARIRKEFSAQVETAR